MSKFFYFLTVVIAVVFLLTSCGLFKDKQENIETSNGRIFPVETVVKPDPSLRGIKVSLPRPVINKTWMQSTNNEAHNIQHPFVNNKIRLAWKISIGKGQDKKNPITSQPVIDETNVYTIDTKAKIVSLSKVNGKIKWKKKLRKKINREGILNGGLAVNKKYLVVTTGTGAVFVLDKENGKILWDVDLSRTIRAAPIISGNNLLILSKDNRLSSYDLQEKKLNWTHEGLEEISTFMGSSSPTVSSGIIIVTYSSGEIYALNELNGSVIWNDNLSLYIQKKSLDNISDIRGNPVIHDNKLYVISYSGKMVAFDLNSGVRLWESNIGGIQTPWVVSRFIFVLSKDNELICLSSKDGKVVWVSKLKDFMDFEKKDKNILWTGPLLAGRMLIVSGSHGIIASISPYSGKFLGAINIKSAVDIQAIVSNKIVFFLTKKGDLIAYK